jgi:hypothetical protein
MPAITHKSYFARSMDNVILGTALPRAFIYGSLINKGSVDATFSWNGGNSIILAAGDSFNLPYLGMAYLNLVVNTTGTTVYIALTIPA